MHELALIEGVVEAVVDQLGVNERVTRVVLEIGQLAGVSVDALEFGFEIAASGTALAGAALEIATIPGRARCRTCGGEHPMPSLAAACPCGSFDRELLAGDELNLKEVEVC